jgi:hypothetical protein
MSLREQCHAVRLAFFLAAVLAIAAPPASAQTPLAGLCLSPDVTTTLGSIIVADEDVVCDDLAGGVSLALTGLPAAADLASYHLDPDGAQLLVFDTTVVLPGNLTATPRDVVRWEGSSYSLLFKGAGAGIPDGTHIDAVTRSGDTLTLSFDVEVTLGGTTYADEDLARYDGSDFVSFFDGSEAGLDPALDLDAAEVLANERLLLSLDGSGIVAGLSFDDEDVLEVGRDGANWQMAYDGSAEHAEWAAADLDVIALLVLVPSGLPFADGFESGDLLAW